jgi:hypothetical protein
MGELAIPAAVKEFLSGSGYYEGENIGLVAKQGERCAFFYAWSIEEYRLWFTLFIFSCVRIRMWVAVMCPDQLHVNKKSSTTCEFSEASEPRYDDIAAMFRKEMGIILPPAPTQ